MIRSDLPPMPDRIAALPVSDRGYPVPFFVSWIDGKPEFRAADIQKKRRCIKEDLCWVCGQKLGRFKCFVIGPMCVINKNTSEPPCHVDCATWSAQACPFMVRPDMVRRENNMPADAREPAGIAIPRNPGVVALYITHSYKLHLVDNGILFSLGEPLSVNWFAEGREATREEICASIDSGLPLLKAQCQDPEDFLLLGKMTGEAMKWLPAKAPSPTT